MKYIVVVPDGMADYPLEELHGQTPMEYAQTPYMDALGQKGLVGLVQTIPDGLPPGSDVGNLSAMGYDPCKSFSGRAPLEAANMNITLADDEIAFRCNLVTLQDEKMLDYSAGHITTKEAASIIETLNQKNKWPFIRFYAGKSYRHLAVIKSGDVKCLTAATCTPPHDITGQGIGTYLPQGDRIQILLDLMTWSKDVLRDHPVNKARRANQHSPATMIWLWGQGQKPYLPSFQEKFGLTGSVISAVDLVNGIGKLAGLHVINVPGATGYYDTNYKGKAEYALASLKENDFVFIHIEAPDEAGHNGDVKMKIESIEKIDKEVIGTIVRHPLANNLRILILPDHRTPVARQTHTSEPVCFLMSGKDIPAKGPASFSEKTAEHAKVFFKSGEELMTHFIGKGA